jgi:hypothetical protein
MRHQTRNFIIGASLFFMASSLFACQKNTPALSRAEDSRTLDDFSFTSNNIVSTDALGRETLPSSLHKAGKQVGLFYFLWHGSHESGIYDVSQLLTSDPTSLYDVNSGANQPAASPLGQFHYWGQPLYGYYHSQDPWVLYRHLELFTMAGIDYLVFDATNSYIYSDVVNSLLAIFKSVQDQGFSVPKVAFYTNSNSRMTIESIYSAFYSKTTYESLWYKIDGKPLIVGDEDDFANYESELATYQSFFTFKGSQWPDKRMYKDNFPWMNWDYPQYNHNGIMSVSVSQAPGYNCAEEAKSNYGRGFAYSDYKNKTERVNEGPNFEGQWASAIKGNKGEVTNAFVTGWNEWMAIKGTSKTTGKIQMVDNFNEEYSRDIEMEKGGYGDNYYLQLCRNIKTFAYEAPVHYAYKTNTIDVSQSDLAAWNNVPHAYKDLVGDALERNFKNAARSSTGTEIYTDVSARNDIADIKVTHDAHNVYFKIDCAKAITSHVGGDQSWMNLYIGLPSEKAETKFANNYNFVINRNPLSGTTSIEKFDPKANLFAPISQTAQYSVSDKTLQIAVPLSALGLKADDCHLIFKVSDHVTSPTDIMDFYVSGDSAPIGRLSYDYGY